MLLPPRNHCSLCCGRYETTERSSIIIVQDISSVFKRVILDFHEVDNPRRSLGVLVGGEAAYQHP